MTDVPTWLPAYLQAADAHAQADGSAIGTGIPDSSPRRVSITVEAAGYLRAAATDQHLTLTSRTRLDATIHPDDRPDDTATVSVCWWPATALIGAYATTLITWDTHLEAAGQLPDQVLPDYLPALSISELVTVAHHTDTLPAGTRTWPGGRRGHLAWTALISALVDAFPAAVAGEFGTLPDITGTAATATGLLTDTLTPGGRVWIRSDDHLLSLRDVAGLVLERSHLIRQARLLESDTRAVTLPAATRPPVLFGRTA